MVNTSLQVIGFLVGVLGWILSIITTFMQAWRKNDVQDEIIELIRRTDGLWTRCTGQATGLWTCDDYDSFFLGLPASLQAARALAVISMVAGLFATLLCSLGLKCTKFGSGNNTLKSRMVIVAGVLHVIGAATIGAAVSWFAANILEEFYRINVGQERYVYGEALFVGWASMVVSVIAGILLCCASWNTEDDVSRGGYTYNPPKPRLTGTDYV